MTGPSVRRMAVAAAMGGGGLTVLTGASIGLVMAEAKLARRAIGQASLIPPRADGLFAALAAPVEPVGIGATVGSGFSDFAAPGNGESEGDQRSPLRFAMIGDSTAAGYGVDRAQDTPGALLAAALAAHAARPVLLANVARVGACSDGLGEQVDELLRLGSAAPQIAAIMIGANDITHRLPPLDAARRLGESVARLQEAGCAVVVGTCPDLGTIRPIQPPLRWLARRWSRRLARFQAREVQAAGGRSVPIGALLGPEFATRSELFGPDRFHPSVEGYATAAAAMLPALAAAAWQIVREPERSAARPGGDPSGSPADPMRTPG